jgi:hypothetical protein
VKSNFVEILKIVFSMPGFDFNVEDEKGRLLMNWIDLKGSREVRELFGVKSGCGLNVIDGLIAELNGNNDSEDRSDGA